MASRDNLTWVIFAFIAVLAAWGAAAPLSVDSHLSPREIASGNAVLIAIAVAAGIVAIRLK